MKTYILPVLSLVLTFHCNVLADVKNPEMRDNAQKALKVRPFDLNDVRLLDGPFKHAQDLSGRSLLNYKPDRLLSRFRTTAGLEPKAEPYFGWEAEGIAGHSLGHYLSGLSLMYASTGDERFRDRVNYIVDELEKIQNANGDGYAMCVPRGKELFKEISEGNIKTLRFDLNGCWVPIYTLHKKLSGLRDAYVLCSNQKALEIERKLADWFNTIIGNLNDQQMQKIMYCEHGGIAEALAELSANTGERKYMEMAEKFHHKEIMDPMIEKRDILSGYHGNTQVPKIIGMGRIYELTGKKEYKTGAEFFWDRVVNHHSYVTGGHGLNEYFGEPDKLNDRLGANTTETCNVYNMLKLTSHLFCWEPRASVADYYERALYNHILSSQHPGDGRVIYNLTLEMGGFKRYQDPESFTCCVSTGMENHSQYGNSIYYHNDRELYVNLFIASELDWKEKGLKITQETKFPDDTITKLTFTCRFSTALAVYIRHPYWAQNSMEIKVNGVVQKVTSKPSSYIKLSRSWQNGDTIEIRLPMSLRLETMPDNPKRVAIMNGPLVLAGELGPVDDPNVQELMYVPVLLTSGKPVEWWVKQLTDKVNTFELDSVGRPRDVLLYPFHNMHEKRYTIYWDIVNNSELTYRQQEFDRIREEKREIESRTVDFVQPGKHQLEDEHNLQFVNSDSGLWHRGRHRRWAYDDGWFSYEVAVINEPVILRVTYDQGRDENVIYEVIVDGEKIVEQVQQKGSGLFYAEYKLPEDLIRYKNKITVKFARPDKTFRRGGVLEVRILKERK